MEALTNFVINNKSKIFLTIVEISVIAFISCSTSKITLIKNGENIGDIAKFNAISDFSNTCKLFNNYSMFLIWFEDSVFHLTYNKELQQWNRDEYYQNIVSVHISPHIICKHCEEHCDKFLYTKETKVGSKGKLPSRFFEKGNKLFFWWDDEYPLTEQMIAILRKYNLLYDDTEGLIGIPEFTIDEQIKGGDYYFCKNDLTKYKRVVTNIGFGYYKPPKLNCN